VRNQTVDQCWQLAFHHIAEVVQRQADAMIGDAILREVIGADFFGPVSGFDLAATFRTDGGLLFF
jgi:hypothetical protein